MMKEHQKPLRITGNGTFKIDTSQVKGEGVTIFVQGDMGAAMVKPYAWAGSVKCHIEDLNEITGALNDSNGDRKCRFHVKGRMDAIEFVVTQNAGGAEFDIAVR